MLWRLWRYSGGDWTLPWRVYHGLDADWRPLDDPAGEQRRIAHVARYRCLLYGFGLAVDVLEHGARDRAAPEPRPKEQVRPSGLILPTWSG